MAELEAAEIPYSLGTWQYGDLTSFLSSGGPVDCAHACEARPECHHWVFLSHNLECELKTQGGYPEDADPQFGRHLSFWGEDTTLRRLRAQPSSREPSEL